jgi:hypothetical protein
MLQDKITIYGPKGDGTYVVEFKTAAGQTLAISCQAARPQCSSISRRACPMDWSCQRRRGRPMMADRDAGNAWGGIDARVLETMPNRVRLPWILPAVWQIAPPLPGFILTPAQHRRRAQDLRDAGRPDLAKQHNNCARIIQHRRQRMH